MEKESPRCGYQPFKARRTPANRPWEHLLKGAAELQLSAPQVSEAKVGGSRDGDGVNAEAGDGVSVRLPRNHKPRVPGPARWATPLPARQRDPLLEDCAAVSDTCAYKAAPSRGPDPIFPPGHQTKLGVESLHRSPGACRACPERRGYHNSQSAAGPGRHTTGRDGRRVRGGS